MNKCLPVYPYPVLKVEAGTKKFLVITDIHIGFEDKINSRGIYVNPRENTDELIEILYSIYSETNIDKLIILGDLKSSVNVITKSEWDNIPYFINSLLKIFEIYLIPGNHDGNIGNIISDKVNIMNAKGMEIDNILFTHGHTLPKISNDVDKIVTGHLHPILLKENSILNGTKVWVQLFLEKRKHESIKNLSTISNDNNNKRIEFIIMPYFNKILDYFRGYSSGKITFNNNSTRSNLPLLENLINKRNWIIEKAYLFSMDGSIIGAEQDLNKILYGR